MIAVTKCWVIACPTTRAAFALFLFQETAGSSVVTSPGCAGLAEARRLALARRPGHCAPGVAAAALRPRGDGTFVGMGHENH